MDRDTEAVAPAANHDPGPDLARKRADHLLTNPDTSDVLPARNIRIGTAGWTDPTLTAPGVFYPDDARTPEARLNFYSTVFPLVEVDSSYYALPSRENAVRWVERTPPDFMFNMKAYALMTGHPTEVARFPKTLKADLPSALRDAKRVYPKDLSDEFMDTVWTHFVDAIQPLVDAGKFGAVLLQYPRWFTASRKSADDLVRARERLGDLPAAVEFRNARWLSPRIAPRTFALLKEHAFSYVCVDEPQGMASSVPPTIAVTNEKLAVARMHGRRAEMWEKPGAAVNERFRYLYDQAELAEWVPRLGQLADKSEQTHVVFNNCYANYATTNALEISELISRVYR